MGTDIWIYPEQYRDGRWQFIGEMEENNLYRYDPEHEPFSVPKDLYDIRNYGLFAILADVRNSAGYECIAPRRGIPGDLSPEIQSYFERHTQPYLKEESDALALAQNEKQRASWIAYDIDRDLQPGWLTLQELLTFPWQEKRIQIYARVDERVAHLFHPERGFPSDTWPSDIRYSYSTTNKESPWCNASWIQTYAEAAGDQFMELLDNFAQRYSTPEKVRFVFWFSS